MKRRAGCRLATGIIMSNLADFKHMTCLAAGTKQTCPGRRMKRNTMAHCLFVKRLRYPAGA